MTDPVEVFRQEYLRRRWQLERDYHVELQKLDEQLDKAAKEHKQALLELENWPIAETDKLAEGVPQ